MVRGVDLFVCQMGVRISSTSATHEPEAVVGRWFFVQVLGERGTPGVVACGVPDSRLPPGGRGPRAAGPIEERSGPVQPVQDSLAKG